MKKLLFVLFCALCGHAAATEVLIQVYYTQGAATWMTNNPQGGRTTVFDQVDHVLADMNAANDASGVAFHWRATYLAVDTDHLHGSAPKDSASMNAQFAWGKNSPYATTNRQTTDASVTVVISDPGINVTQGAIAARQPVTDDGDGSVAALPIAYVDTQLESSLVTMIVGRTRGYNTRKRIYPSDPYVTTPFLCYHSRESGPSDSSTLVPQLSWWITNHPASGPLYQSEAPGAFESCRAYLGFRNTVEHISTSSYNHAAFASTGTGAGTCTIYSSANAVSEVTGTNFVDRSGLSASVIPDADCPDVTVPRYAANGAVVPEYGNLPLGDSNHDTVGTMNARLSAVIGFKTKNLSRKKEAAWGWLPSWAPRPTWW